MPIIFNLKERILHKQNMYIQSKLKLIHAPPPHSFPCPDQTAKTKRPSDHKHVMRLARSVDQRETNSTLRRPETIRS